MQQNRWEAAAAGPINSEISSRVILASGDALVNRRSDLTEGRRIRPPTTRIELVPEEHGNGGGGDRKRASETEGRENLDDAGKSDDSGGIGYKTVGAGSYARHS